MSWHVTYNLNYLFASGWHLSYTSCLKHSTCYFRVLCKGLSDRGIASSLGSFEDSGKLTTIPLPLSQHKHLIHLGQN